MGREALEWLLVVGGPISRAAFLVQAEHLLRDIPADNSHQRLLGKLRGQSNIWRGLSNRLSKLEEQSRRDSLWDTPPETQKFLQGLAIEFRRISQHMNRNIRQIQESRKTGEQLQNWVTFYEGGFHQKILKYLVSLYLPDVEIDALFNSPPDDAAIAGIIHFKGGRAIAVVQDGEINSAKMSELDSEATRLTIWRRLENRRLRSEHRIAELRFIFPQSLPGFVHGNLARKGIVAIGLNDN